MKRAWNLAALGHQVAEWVCFVDIAQSRKFLHAINGSFGVEFSARTTCIARNVPIIIITVAARDDTLVLLIVVCFDL
jgi:hypothetical protein